METIAVAGLGLLGRGIAAALLGAGYRVIGHARTTAEHEEAIGEIAEAIRELVERGVVSSDRLKEWRERFIPVQTLSEFAESSFVIESVLEDLAVKLEVFDQIESAIAEDVPIASNTSAIPIGKLQQSRRVPGRFLGMHWAEPAHATRFLELIRGEATADEPFAKAIALARGLGKEPSLVRRDVPGFIVNRLGYAMYREAMHLLESGVADAESIDQAFCNAVGLWATLCGPLRWIDLTGGPSLYARAMAGVWPDLDQSTELPKTLRMFVESDARGIANGRGFYEYTPEEVRLWKAKLRDRVWAVRALQDANPTVETTSCR